ncbi:MFS transporter [Bacillus kexueae]|uniref:MFS transporter n=1 Tax=Aeribacillus kexueae TaxID=2078952 RepID=UPI001FAE9B31|nr:MFS transporter [Bacillus kexueae]
MMKEKGEYIMRGWHSIILLVSIGISNIGDWVYLISLNLIVLNETDSPFAVAVLYMLKPFAALITNSWAGSVIDRMNKRRLMIGIDFLRAFLLFIIPILPSIFSMYAIVFIINIASSTFRPASMSYFSLFVQHKNRTRFNAWRSFVESGGFVIGPAIAGMFFIVGNEMTAITFNGFMLLISAILLLFLPDVDQHILSSGEGNKLTLKTVQSDWRLVFRFSKSHSYIIITYVLFSSLLVMATAIDSLEAAFAKQVVELTDSQYALLVSIAGGGYAFGSIIVALCGKKVTGVSLLGKGSVFVSIGYLIYAFSTTFAQAATGFVILSLSLALANTGFYSFYQTNIPQNIVGRIVSMYEVVGAFSIICITFFVGIAAQLLPLQVVVIASSCILLVLTIHLMLHVERNKKQLMKNFEQSKEELSLYLS